MRLDVIDHTHDPALRCWVESADAHPEFPVQNLPLGIFIPDTEERPRIGTAIGDYVLDLASLAESLPASTRSALTEQTLNRLLGLPNADRAALRRAISALLCDDDAEATVAPHLHPAASCTMMLPCRVGDYTDFYVGIHHATNVGRLFRPDNPLLPNYKYVPIGYHGRASSVRVSGLPVARPSGQRKAPDDERPTFGPSQRLDFELELGVWIGIGNEPGEPIPIDRAGEHVAGLCLLNDWSARDLQAWEYVPLGPFLSKSFHTSVSPWMVTAEALAPFRVAQASRPAGDPDPLPYLAETGAGALAIDLEILLSSARMRAEGMPPVILSRSAARHMYWTVQQMVTHHTSNGCDLSPGDLLGSGTISGPDSTGVGSLLELNEGGKRVVSLPTGETRTFLEDGDEVVLRGIARADGAVPIGFGECRAVIVQGR